MIAVVLDVGGEIRAVAPAENDLLAPVGCLPIHFHGQLVGLDQPRRFTESRAYLGQKEDEAVGPRAIAGERRIGLRFQSAFLRTADERERFG